MKTTFDTNSILFKILKGNMSIKGNYYTDDSRSEDSQEEDVVINTIDLEQDALPQKGTSNVNIYVSDTPKKINGKKQLSINSTRLKTLAKEALELIRNANIGGVTITPGNMTTMYEPNAKQHFVNIRVDWNIQID